MSAASMQHHDSKNGRKKVEATMTQVIDPAITRGRPDTGMFRNANPLYCCARTSPPNNVPRRRRMPQSSPRSLRSFHAMKLQIERQPGVVGQRRVHSNRRRQRGHSNSCRGIWSWGLGCSTSTQCGSAPQKTASPAVREQTRNASGLDMCVSPSPR
jgi:hypothetical protein